MSKLSLQEQMLKAGLVNEKKLKKAKKGSKKSRVQAKEAREAVEANKAAQLERDKELSLKMKEQQLAKEFKAQVKQLISMNKIVINNGEVKYNFTDGTTVKSLYVDEMTRKQLANGLLSLARDEESYAIIPSVVAEKIAMRDQETIIEIQVTEEAPDEDDPYKDFVVPDDLMW